MFHLPIHAPHRASNEPVVAVAAADDSPPEQPVLISLMPLPNSHPFAEASHSTTGLSHNPLEPVGVERQPMFQSADMQLRALPPLSVVPAPHPDRLLASTVNAHVCAMVVAAG